MLNYAFVIALLIFTLSCTNPFRENHLIEKGNQVVIQIEIFKRSNGRLPESLSEIGQEEKLEGPIYYRKETDTKYILWFGAELGESITYNSDTNTWEPIGRSGPSIQTSLTEYRTDNPIDVAESTSVPYPTTTEERQTQNGSITFKGVSLTTNIPSAQTIEAVLEPPLFLEIETDKPDSVVPQYISLKLKDQYPGDDRKYFYSPEVNIYTIEGFRQALSKSKHYVSELNSEINALKKIITQQPKRIENLPRIPFHDGGPTITTHIKYASFKNGKGVFYLTHYDIEPSLIGNGRLTYVFQGLTDDGKHYIFATFPVILNSLPDSNATRFEDYELPTFYYDPKTVEANDVRFQKYLSKMTKLLERTSPNKFNPALPNIEQTVISLDVNWTE